MSQVPQSLYHCAKPDPWADWEKEDYGATICFKRCCGAATVGMQAHGCKA